MIYLAYSLHDLLTKETSIIDDLLDGIDIKDQFG